MNLTDSRVIVYFSSINWNFSWHRQQEMATFLAQEGYTILFVEPQKKNNWFGERIKKLGDNIYILTPAGLPFERIFTTVNYLNGILTRFCLTRYLSALRLKPIIWFDRVHGCAQSFFLENYECVYDLIDDLFAFGRYKNKKMLKNIENNVLRKCKLLLSSSQSLLTRKQNQSSIGTKGMFVPNGVDFARFMYSRSKGEGTTIRVGFIGHISRRRLNYALIKEVAAFRSDWDFIFIGPGDTKDKVALSGDNIKVYDSISGDDIPSVISSFTVGIIPYECKEWSMSYVFPRKALEYLSAGIPVISTPMKEIVGLSPYIKCAETASDFAEAIESSIGRYSKAEIQSFASAYDWKFLLEKVKKELAYLYNN